MTPDLQLHYMEVTVCARLPLWSVSVPYCRHKHTKAPRLCEVSDQTMEIKKQKVAHSYCCMSLFK